MELHAVAAVFGGCGQAEAFLQLDMNHGAVAGPVDSCVPTGGDWEALGGELAQMGGFRPGQEALQRGVHVELGSGSALRNAV